MGTLARASSSQQQLQLVLLIVLSLLLQLHCSAQSSDIPLELRSFLEQHAGTGLEAIFDNHGVMHGRSLQQNADQPALNQYGGVTMEGETIVQSSQEAAAAVAIHSFHCSSYA